MEHDQITTSAVGSTVSVLPPSLADWVASAAARGLTGQQASTWLTTRGWPPSVGAAAAREVERLAAEPFRAICPPPGLDRQHQHAFAYVTLFATVGLSALAFGSTVHLLLAWAFQTRPGSQALANWITLLICTLPFAVATHRVVARIERDDPLARYSQVRDASTMLLLWAAGLVGGTRLLSFVHQLVTALVVDRDLGSLGWDLAHVTTVVVMAGWVFAWTWRLRHAPREAAATGSVSQLAAQAPNT